MKGMSNYFYNLKEMTASNIPILGDMTLNDLYSEDVPRCYVF